LARAALESVCFQTLDLLDRFHVDQRTLRDTVLEAVADLERRVEALPDTTQPGLLAPGHLL